MSKAAALENVGCCALLVLALVPYAASTGATKVPASMAAAVMPIAL